MPGEGCAGDRSQRVVADTVEIVEIEQDLFHPVRDGVYAAIPRARLIPSDRGEC